MKTVLVKLTPYDPVGAARVNLYITNVNDVSATLPAGQSNEYLPILAAGPVISRSVFNGDFSDIGDNTGSSLTVRLDESALTAWLGYVWAGASVEVRVGNFGDPYSAFAVVQTLSATGLTRSSGVTCDIGLTSSVNLARQLLYLSFAGTDNGSGSDSGEGRAEVRGTLKPWLSGAGRYIDPVLIDAPRQIYCYHGYGSTLGATNCMEGGVDKGASSYTWATFAAMVAQVMTAGQWGCCPSLGMIRLGGQPSFPITIHAQGDAPGGTMPSKIGDVLKRILEGPGGIAAPAINATNLAAITTSRPDAIDIYHTDQGTVQQVLTEVMLSANGYWIEDAVGGIQLGIVPPGLTGSAAGFPATTILNSGDAFPSWSGSGTIAADGLFTTFGDVSAGFDQRASANLTTVTAYSIYTVIWRIKKDAIPKTTRFGLMRIGGAVVSLDFWFDTSNGEVNCSTGALPYGSLDGVDSWVCWIQVQPTSSAAIAFAVFPAVGIVAAGQPMNAANHVPTVTGSIGFRALQLMAGAQTPSPGGAPTKLLDLDGLQSPAVKEGGEDSASVPAYRVRLGGVASHFTHNPNDVAASIIAAQSSADSKAKTYPPGSSPPSVPTPAVGDLWPDNSTGAIVMRRWTGAAWQAVTEVGTAVALLPIGSVAAADIVGNSFKRTATGTDYNYAVVSSVAFAGSAYAQMGAVATGYSMVSLDDDNTTTVQASMNWMLTVQDTGSWALYKAGVTAASGAYGTVVVDTNIMLRYRGNKVEAMIGNTIVATQAENSGLSYFAKWHAYQAANYRQLAAGYASIIVQAGSTAANSTILNSSGTGLVDSQLLNTAITITPSGALSGGGGGAITGLDFGNVSGATKPSNNADVTAAVTPTVTGSTSFAIAADSSGTITTALPFSRAFVAKQGTTDVSMTTSWVLGGGYDALGLTVDNTPASATRGQVTVGLNQITASTTRSTGSGTATLTATLPGGAVIALSLVFTKTTAAAPVGGGTGATSATITSMSSPTNATSTAMTSEYIVRSDGAGKLKFSMDITFSGTGGTHPNPYMYANVAYATTSQGTLIDVFADTVPASTPDTFTYPSWDGAGSVYLVLTQYQMPAANTDYYFKVKARRGNATYATSIIYANVHIQQV